MIKNLDDIAILLQAKSKEERMSQIFISDKLDISKNTVNKIFKGGNTSLEMVINLFALFNYDVLIFKGENIVNISKAKDTSLELRKIITIEDILITDLADKSDISRSQLTNITRGHSKIMMEILIKILMAMDYEIKIQKKISTL